jgi:putative flavoprotein involved in K+ transport
MTHIDTVVVGAGHAGLAVSRLLTAAGHEHVVLERGRVGERWRTERWDSLRLLTPNWMTRLPDWCYQGPDPDGYLSAGDFVHLLDRYAASFAAPVVKANVEHVCLAPGVSARRYLVVTDRGTWRARQVVIATGPHGAPHMPATVLAGPVEMVHAQQYRNPGQLPPGAVLVVGASSSGVQIAHELARAGRPTVLAVGRHTRMPRRYRGLDIFWWLSTTGRLARTIDNVPDASAARHEPSLQLLGDPDAQSLDLAALQRCGVRLAGRLERVDGGRAWFGDHLAGTVAAADRRMHRFLDAADAFAHQAGLDDRRSPAVRPGPVRVPATPGWIDLRAEQIGSIVLATGYRPHLPWLHVPVLAPDGSVEQYRGVTAAPGVYVVGQRFQHRRDSGYIDGARHDAEAVVRDLLDDAGQPARRGPLTPSREPAA